MVGKRTHPLAPFGSDRIHRASWLNSAAASSGVEVIRVPGGPGVIGDNRFSAERPRRIVQLSPYWLSRTPVTVSQFRIFTLHTETSFDWISREPEWGWQNDHPMVQVTWDEAREYCLWAGGDLPTETQFERAARGREGSRFPWGDTWTSDHSVHSFKVMGDRESPEPVNRRCSVYATGLGHIDLCGNVWQWCRDWYESGYLGASNADPEGPLSGTYRVLRGASWLDYDPLFFRASFRLCFEPDYRNHNCGFRLGSA